ncbi:MAG: dihydrodipicolinate synthase family protein [Acidobacteria bacterium]|nr:dihydrodipicolinate synthase family protein [Acidobacteriota bacterium]MDA1237066.1 dihydrodipicolinate synthase family protein [Acidobacteriota bacterium]
MTRRNFFAQTGLLALASTRLGAAESDSFRGVYPILQTPYLEDGPLDFAALGRQAHFVDRAGAHGMVWPQLASEYALLTFDERIRGAETLAEAKHTGLKPRLVIGVQAEDTATAVRYARHAAKIKPDAIIALPARKPNQNEFDLDATRAYYKAVAEACPLPMFIQAIGNMSVEYVTSLVQEIPNIYFVKDEAGHTLSRISEFAHVDADKKPIVFTGGHGRTMLDEMSRGSRGNMPAAAWVDLYVSAWELWEQGRSGEALDIFSKNLLLVMQVQAYGLSALHYILTKRGVFSNWNVRAPNARPLDGAAREALDITYDFVKPYLRA